MVSEIKAEFRVLDDKIKDRLLSYFGSQEKMVQSLVLRYGEAAFKVFIKNCVEKKSFDPLLMVDIPTGRIIFDHLDEFNAREWTFLRPRYGSLVAALKGIEGYHPPDMANEGGYI